MVDHTKAGHISIVSMRHGCQKVTYQADKQDFHRRGIKDNKDDASQKD